MAMAATSLGEEGEDDDEILRLDSINDDDEENNFETSDETDDPAKLGVAEKRKKKLRLARLRRKTKAMAYEFSGGTDVVGIVFLEIGKITDLPPERNSKNLS